MGSKKQDDDVRREPAPVTDSRTSARGAHEHTHVHSDRSHKGPRSLRLIIITGGAEADFRSPHTRSDHSARSRVQTKTTYGYFRNAPTPLRHLDIRRAANFGVNKSRWTNLLSKVQGDSYRTGPINFSNISAVPARSC